MLLAILPTPLVVLQGSTQPHLFVILPKPSISHRLEAKAARGGLAAVDNGTCAKLVIPARAVFFSTCFRQNLVHHSVKLGKRSRQ